MKSKIMKLYCYTILTVFILIGIIPVSIQAQECGTNPKDQASSYFFDKEVQIQKHKKRDMEYIPIQIHIVSASNGALGIDSSRVYDEFIAVNEQFALIDLEFVSCGNINYIRDNNYINFRQYHDEGLADQHDVLDVVNIYFVPTLEDDDGVGTLCGYAYNIDIKPRLFMSNNCSTNGSTLTHELGHTFSLPHTHSTSAGREFVNGSNCSFAGDKICDTPADPKLGTLIVNSNCDYTGNERDANGDRYSPDVGNIMSYSRKKCRDHFSQGQLDVISDFYEKISYLFYCEAISTSTKDISQLEEINVYPSPAVDRITVEAELNFSAVEIHDLLGNRVFHQSTKNSKIEIPVSALTAGIYVVKVLFSDQHVTQKFIKH